MASNLTVFLCTRGDHLHSRARLSRVDEWRVPDYLVQEMGLDIYQLTSVSIVHRIWTYWIIYLSKFKIPQCSWCFFWDQEEVKGETALWSQSSRAAHGFSKSQWSVAGLGALHLHPGVFSVWSVVRHWNFLPLFYQQSGSKLLKSLRQWWFVLDAITDQTCL